AGIFGLIALTAWGAMAWRATDVVVVGSKNFAEQLVLGEIVAQALERNAGLRVDRRLNLGGTLICDRALSAGDIDVYVEYTGTALTAIFHQPLPPAAPGADAASRGAETVYGLVRDLYARSGRTLLPPLGFD